jgi:hypothetical protein
MRELHDPLADPALREQLAGEHKQRHRDQDERLDAADEGKKDTLQRVLHAVESHDASRRGQQ